MVLLDEYELINFLNRHKAPLQEVYVDEVTLATGNKVKVEKFVIENFPHTRLKFGAVWQGIGLG